MLRFKISIAFIYEILIIFQVDSSMDFLVSVYSESSINMIWIVIYELNILVSSSNIVWNTFMKSFSNRENRKMIFTI